MKQWREHKFHLISLLLIFLLFLLSVHVRKDKLSQPLSQQYAWVTAHTLMTVQIWDETGGPAGTSFIPVYTYEGAGNKGIAPLGGVMGKNGKMHYTSYPPFSFLLAYYGIQMIGGNPVSSIRTLGLILHLCSAFLIYFIIRSIRNTRKDQLQLAGIIGAALYLFSAGPLWFHSNLYFADMVVIPLLLVLILLYTKLIYQNFKHKNRILIGFGVFTFFAVYTEWIALFFAGFASLFLLIKYLSNRKRIWLQAALVIGLTALCTIGLTIVQYCSIQGWDELLEVSINKYQERSGFQKNQEGIETFGWRSSISYTLMKEHLNQNFAMVINLLGIIPFLLLPVVIWKKTRLKIEKLAPKIEILSVIFLAIITHYLLFFNFNSLHNFGNLKTGLFMILLISVVILIIEEVINWRLRIALAAILFYIIVPRSLLEVKRFDGLFSYTDSDAKLDQMALTIKKYSHDEQTVFVNVWATPGFMYKAHRNVFLLRDTSRLTPIMKFLKTEKAQYYHEENGAMKYFLDIELNQERVKVVNKVVF
ncbi:MAG: hypothetical protein HUJ25_11535 [Crocinitomicaceae bacterium]|nr:hypothetical protein [Crocinitomicaceae bacterium]